MLQFLYSIRSDFDFCRDIEARCMSCSTTRVEYESAVRHMAYNLWYNPDLNENVLYADDSHMTTNTLVGVMESEKRARQLRFERILQEKYDSLNDFQFRAIVKCRRCGSEEVTWEEKQTRSADEGCSLFCQCKSCFKRWVLR